MKAIGFLINCCLILACTPKELETEWATFDFDTFTIEAPSKWEKFTSQGYDSKVGGITNGKDTLRYDYGWYSYRFTNETTKTHIIIEINRDGYPTKMVKPKKTGKGLIGIYYDLGSPLRLTLYGNSRNEMTFMRIINSVKVK